jgi:TonB family protein
VELEPRWKAFSGNLIEFLPLREKPGEYPSPGTFWSDVFVTSRLPWFHFVQSALCHVLAILAVWGFVRFMPTPAQIAPPIFTSADVIATSGPIYLPPLDTRSHRGQVLTKGDPVLATQPILSVPPEGDNRTQTIVTPPDIKLKQNVPLPNIVAWSNSSIPVPLAATSRAASEMKLPSLPNAIVAPPPEVTRDVSRRSPNLTSDVIAPPPAIDVASTRNIGDINIGHPDVVAPAPQLPMSEQRTLNMAQQTLGGVPAAAVPPPPTTQGVNSSGSGRIIALGIHPDAAAPPVPPAGNRRGNFEASPEGKPEATGTPSLAGGAEGSSGAGSGQKPSGIPPGLFVGKASPEATTGGVAGVGTSGNGGSAKDGGTLVASVTPPRTSAVPSKAAAPVLDDKATSLDRQVFGGRRFYSMALNMPNLNSAGGSWIVRFAELKNNDSQGDLFAPVATHKVDPAYPLELMRHNVEGTVALYAVIHSDGHVSDIRVLRSVDDRLDQYAMDALSRWLFQPATKNGAPVALEAVVMIPFKAIKKF